MHFIYHRYKLQNTGSNVTRMATKVRLASQHVVKAQEDSSKLPLPRLGILAVKVAHQLTIIIFFWL